MPREDETTFVLHGLDIDNRIVRANVFVQKLRALLTALQAVDKFTNGKSSFTYMLTHLEDGSASATVRQKQRSTKAPAASPIAYFQTVTNAVYNGDVVADRYPPWVVGHVRKLSNGVAKTFSHAELAFVNDNVIRIDDFLAAQSERVVDMLEHGIDKLAQRYYRGVATGSFDGVLKEIDARGTLLRGKLVLSAGDLEVDCVMNKERVPEAAQSFDKRVVIDGTAHYDGRNQLPVRIDVRTIKIVKESPDLLRWKGTFRQVIEEDEDGWDG